MGKILKWAYVAMAITILSSNLIASDNDGDEKMASPEAPETRALLVQDAAYIFEQNAQEFRDIAELSLDVALHLLGKPPRFQPNAISPDLVAEAFNWMGGAVNYGKDHEYPESARQDARFQALHILRASSYYLEWYFRSKLAYVALSNQPSQATLNNVQVMLDSVCRSIDSELASQGSLEVKQTAQDKIRFGDFPPLDVNGMLKSPWQAAKKMVNKALAQPDLQKFAGELAPGAVYSKIFNAIRGFDSEFSDLTVTFMGYQLAKDGAKDVSDRDYRQYKKYAGIRDPKKKETLINAAIEGKLKPFIDYFFIIDKDILTVLSEPVAKVQEQPAVQAADSKPAPKKRGKNRRGKRGQITPPALAKPSNQAGLIEPDLPPAPAATPENEPPEVVVDPAAELAKEAASEPPALVPEPISDVKSAPEPVPKPVSKKIPAPKAAAKPKQLPAPFLKIEVVEKILDIFGNKEGMRKAKNGYQRAGWGKSRDFVKTLEKAGWLIDQRQLVSGRVVNEKHKSSTKSFQMPPTPGIKPIYIKFHGDHESGGDMREIARHFIIKALEACGYSEQFFINYHQKHFYMK